MKFRAKGTELSVRGIKYGNKNNTQKPIFIIPSPVNNNPAYFVHRLNINLMQKK